MDYTISKAIYNKIRGLRFLRTLLVGSSIILIALYIVSLSVLRYFPIYPDEIAIRILISRLFYYSPLFTSLLPSCETVNQPFAFIWYLPNAIEWLIHGQSSDLKIIRMIGIGFSICFVTVLTLQLLPGKHENLSSVSMPANRSYWVIVSAGLVLSLVSIGVLPVFLIMNRNEQLLISGLIALLLIFPGAKNIERSFARRVGLVVIFFTSVSIMLYVHPKAILMTPVFLLVGYRVFSLFNKRWLSMGLMLTLFFLLIRGFIAWSMASECKASPGVSNYLKGMSIAYRDIFYDAHHFFSQIIQSLSDTTEYFKKIGFQTTSEISYFPPIPSSILYKSVNILININLSMLFLSLCVLLPLFYYKDFLCKQYFSLHLLLLLTFILITGGAVICLTKHWYDVDYFWIVCVIVFLFFIKGHFQYIIKKNFCSIMLLYLIFSGIFSLSMFLYAVAPSIKSGFVGPGTSLRDFKYHELSSVIKKLGKSCQIEPLNSKNLILDDLTYLYFRKTENPILITYLALNSILNGQNNNLRQKIQGSSGLITRCVALSEGTSKYTVHIGSICCASKKNVQRVMGMHS